MTAPNIVHDESFGALQERPLKPALLKGALCKCPRCGEGSVFHGYLKVRTECEACHLDLSKQRADDGPAYVVILIVCHLMGFILLEVVDYLRQSPLETALVLSVLALVMTLVMLPRVKGMFVAFQWAKRMHGF